LASARKCASRSLFDGDADGDADADADSAVLLGLGAVEALGRRAVGDVVGLLLSTAASRSPAQIPALGTRSEFTRSLLDANPLAPRISTAPVLETCTCVPLIIYARRFVGCWQAGFG
jgi:hypothetical protein